MQKSSRKHWQTIQQHINRINYHDQMEFISRMQGWFNIHNFTYVIFHISRMKGKKMIMSIDTKNVHDKIQLFHDEHYCILNFQSTTLCPAMGQGLQMP